MTLFSCFQLSGYQYLPASDKLLGFLLPPINNPSVDCQDTQTPGVLDTNDTSQQQMIIHKDRNSDDVLEIVLVLIIKFFSQVCLVG